MKAVVVVNKWVIRKLKRISFDQKKVIKVVDVFFAAFFVLRILWPYKNFCNQILSYIFALDTALSRKEIFKSL